MSKAELPRIWINDAGLWMKGGPDNRARNLTSNNHRGGGMSNDDAEKLADECRPELFGFTIIDRDGGEMHTSEPEYLSYKEAERAGNHSLCDMNGGSLEIWLWDDSLEDVTKTWDA